MISAGVGESQRLILDHLKRRGPAGIPELAASLELSVETIRSHMKSLRGEGLVQARGRRRRVGRGRPEILYELTEAADTLFPGGGRLLKELAAFVAEQPEPGLLEDFFEMRAERRREALRPRLAKLGDDARAEEVARMLTEEGFMAEVDRDTEGRPLLRLCHCPVRELLDVTKAPCRAELRLVRDLLGKHLTRVSYIPLGDHACCYRLREVG